MLKRRSAAAAVVLGCLVAVLVACADAPRGERVVHTERSAYQTLFVTDADDRRCLRFGDPASSFIQSCRLHADPVRLAFSYARAMAAVLLAWAPAPRRVLVIGVGGGSIPTSLAAVRTDLVIDAVDIDAGVVRVAERFFALDPGPRLRVHVADGAAFVPQARARGQAYDAVLLDAFDADGVARPLFTEAFLREVKGILAPDGVFLVNTVDSPGYEGERATVATVFGAFRVVLPGEGTINRLLVATPDPARLPAADALFARLPSQRDALERLGIDEAWVRRLEVSAGPPLPSLALAPRETRVRHDAIRGGGFQGPQRANAGQAGG